MWKEIGTAERRQSRNDIFYSACVTVGQKGEYGKPGYRPGTFVHPRWTAYDDANFWMNVAPDKRRWIKTEYCCSCCKGHKVRLDYQTLKVYEWVGSDEEYERDCK